jgi:hypothetical protein
MGCFGSKGILEGKELLKPYQVELPQRSSTPSDSLRPSTAAFCHAHASLLCSLRVTGAQHCEATTPAFCMTSMLLQQQQQARLQLMVELFQ